MNVSRSEFVGVMVGLGVSSAPDWDAAKCTAKLASAGGLAKYRDVGQTIPDEKQSELFNAIVAAQSAGETVTVVDDVTTTTADANGTAPAPGGTSVPVNGKPSAKTKPKPAAKPASGKSKPAVKPAKTVPATKPGKAKPAAKSKPSATATALAKRVAVKNGSAKPTAKTGGKPKPAAKPATTEPRTGGRELIPLPPGMERGSYAARMYLWKLRHGKRGYSEMTKTAVTALAIVAELKNAGKPANKPKPITKEALLSVLCEKFPKKNRDSLSSYINNMVPTRLRDKFGLHVRKQPVSGSAAGYYIVGDGRTPAPEPKPGVSK